MTIECGFCSKECEEDFFSVRHWKNGKLVGEFAICLGCAVFG